MTASTPTPAQMTGEHDEDEDGDRVAEFPHHATRSEYRIVLATMPLPANQR